MTTYTDPADVLRAVPAYLDEHGWCQGRSRDNDGRCCLRGAINALAGRASLAAESAFTMLHAVGIGSIAAWNDASGRTVEQVKALCLRAAKVNG